MRKLNKNTFSCSSIIVNHFEAIFLNLLLKMSEEDVRVVR